SEAQLAALDRLDRAEGLRQPAVEPAVPLHVGAEPHRTAEGDHLEHAAERVALLLGRVDRGDHRGRGGRIGAADLRGLGAPAAPGSGAPTAIVDFQFSQSRLAIWSVIGLPSVEPHRTPERMRTWSRSIFMRPPRP